MKKTLKKAIVREITWLIIILLLSIPLALFTNWLLNSHFTTQAVNDLDQNSIKFLEHYFKVDEKDFKIDKKKNLFELFLYFWMVVGCYVARLSAGGANMLVTKIPEDF